MESFPLFQIPKDWKIVTQLYENEWITDLEVAFSNWLLEDNHSPTEQEFCFLSYIMACARKGHLCVKVHEQTLEPMIWKDDRTVEAVIKGYQKLNNTTFSGRLFFEKNRIYLQRNNYFVRCIYSALDRIFSSKRRMRVDEIRFKRDLQEKLKCKAVLLSQAEAIESVIKRQLTMIIGGPGTGKTYCAAQLMELLNLSTPFERPLKVYICAPTGKAASHLHEKLPSCNNIMIESQTLHRLLQNHPFAHLEDHSFISADLVIVDEASMIDAKLFAHLFSLIKNETSILIMGDPNQLPPVEIGTIFCDLQEIGKMHHATHELTAFQRFENRQILQFTQAILEESPLDVDNKLDGAVKIVPWKNVQNELKNCFNNYPNPSEEPTDPELLLNQLKQFRILSPFRKKEYGMDHINRLFYEQLCNRAKKGMWIHIPIIIRKNEKSLELYNGMTGVISMQIQNSLEEELQFQKNDQAYFLDGKNLRAFNCYELPVWDYAFCLSVHQSQGSEYEKILLLLPESSDIFGKELLYTAATRAKKTLSIIAEKETLFEAQKKSSQKTNGLLDYFLS